MIKIAGLLLPATFWLGLWAYHWAMGCSIYQCSLDLALPFMILSPVTIGFALVGGYLYGFTTGLERSRG